jgi:hypothetical protein
MATRNISTENQGSPLQKSTMEIFTNLKPVMMLSVSLLVCVAGAAQDFHYVQAVASPLNINPGLVGGFDGNDRFSFNFRRQWGSIPVPFLQVSDRTGDAQLSFTQIGLNAGYSLPIFPKKGAMLTVAVAGSGIQRSFDTANLRWDDQYTLKDGYAENISTGERFSSSSRVLGDVSAGFNLHFPYGKGRTAFNFGVGGFHLNQPRKNFFDEKPANLNARLSARLAGAVQMSQYFDLTFSLDGQVQSVFRQGLIGVGGLYHLSTKKTKELAVQLAAFYRSGDAVIPMAALHFTAWQVYFSYDITLSSLTSATKHRGGPELSVVYIIKQVPKVPFCKTCPIQM